MPLLRDNAASDERLLWTGQPDPGRVAKRSLPLFFAGLAAVLLYVLLEGRLLLPHFRILQGPGAALLQSSVFHAGMYGIPAAGVALMLAPFLACQRALRTEFRVTDRRVMMVSRGRFGRRVRHAGLAALARPVLRMREDRFGDILFRPGKEEVPDGAALLRGFSDVRDAFSVYDLIISQWKREQARLAGMTPAPDYIELLLQGRRIIGCECADEVQS